MKGRKKGKQFFIDTNIFLRIFIKEDEKIFSDCLKFLEFLKQRQINAFTSTIILLEINFVLTSFYRFEKEKVCYALESIIDLPYLKFIDDFDIRQALTIYKKSKFKFVDCLLSSFLVQKADFIIVSYDRDFDKLGVKRLEPKEIVG